MTRVKEFNEKVSPLIAEIKKKQSDLADLVNKCIKVGDTVAVRRGRSIWRVVFIGADHGMYSGYFRGHSASCKIHTFHVSDIVGIFDDEQE